MTASQSSSVMLNRIRSRGMPALLTTMDSPPSPSAVATSSSAVLRWLMSPGTATPLLPTAAISASTSEESRAAAMSFTTTVAPARASPTASARPSPAAAPVTTATRPDRSVASECVVNLRIPLVSAVQCGSRAFRNGLLRELLLVAGHGIELDDGVVLVVEIEQVRGDSQAYRVAFATVAIDFYSHDKPPCSTPTNHVRVRIRPDPTGASVTPAWTPRLERVTTGEGRRVRRRRVEVPENSEDDPMRIGYSPEQEELRRELRAYFTKLMTPERAEALSSSDGEMGRGSVYRDTVAQMGKDGWLTLSWPKEFGGQERPPMDGLIFNDEASIANVPVPFLTINSVAPTIMAFGTEEQKKFFLPTIASGDLHFSIGYSEPGAGTDLAALRTTAVRDGDDYVINGQKMWTSLIAYADYVWLAVRTAPAKHRGISMLIVPTTAEGFSWTPVHTMAGVDTSATYYQDVRVPASSLVGEENGGWKLVTNQLNHERVALVSAQPIFVALNGVREWAQNTKDIHGNRLIDSEWVQLNLARVHAKAEVLKLINWELASATEAAPSPADASAAKVYGTELATEAYRLLMEVLGTAATLRTDSPGALLRGRVERMHRSCLILTFGGGTNEIQRDIIGMVALGLPRVNR